MLRCTMTLQGDNDWTAATPEAIAKALRQADMLVDPADITLLQREDRFAALLPGDWIAWFPLNRTGQMNLAREARVLGILARRCDFRVPTVEHRAAGGWQLRRSVPGQCDPVATYRRTTDSRDFATVLGAGIGRMIASQHQAVPLAELRGWLPDRPSWPEPKAKIQRDLALVLDDAPLIRRAMQIIERYERPDDDGPTLVHADLGFHNMVVDQSTGSLLGVFDYDDAALADRHYDFRYLLLDVPDEALLLSAIAAYRAAGGGPIDIERVYLLNAASAVGFLALRAGHGPDERPAGRTLVEDINWTRLALARVENASR